jgi:chorismate mutase/prephenate dehydratase
MENIEIIRKEIDKIDDKITELLNIRAELALKIGDLKRKSNLEISQPKREEQILERIRSRVKILSGEDIEAIWREILNACRYIQA